MLHSENKPPVGPPSTRNDPFLGGFRTYNSNVPFVCAIIIVIGSSYFQLIKIGNEYNISHSHSPRSSFKMEPCRYHLLNSYASVSQS
jgi:hypothetical protein